PTSATRTAAATPVDVGRSPMALGATSETSRVMPVPISRKTDPLPFASAASSSTGVALPETPAVMDPVAPSQIAPDTVRDIAMAKKAERRRALSTVGILMVIAAVAVGGYFAGRRSNEPRGAASATATPTANAIATAIATASATATATATTTATASESAP